MFNYIWPVVLVVISNIVYQICTKSVPGDVSPFASLTVTYLAGTVCAAVMYLLTGSHAEPLKEFTKLNWSSFVLGFAIVGLEVGFIYAYKAGWQVSTMSIVQSSFLAVALIFAGFLLYKEPLSWNKLVGVAICLVGLFFINFR